MLHFFYFYPRPPRGGRRTRFEACKGVYHISIHALREEGDPIFSSSSLTSFDFYPRPPRGGRPALTDGRSGAGKFLSTPSARRATVAPPPLRGVPDISIHALREEGDLKPLQNDFKIFRYFYPRPPRGGRLCTGQTGETLVLFLSTPSARRATSEHGLDATGRRNFYPRPPRGGRRAERIK